MPTPPHAAGDDPGPGEPGTPSGSAPSPERRPAESDSAPAAAIRIVADAAVYRLRKREGGNLVTSVTLALALALPPWDIAYRFGFGALLNLFVYLLNDCFDVRLDLDAPGRDTERTRFLFGHIRTGWIVVGLLGVLLAAAGLAHGWDLFVAFASTAVVVALYSGILKRVPLADVVAMGAWGVTMALVGFPLDSRSGWLFAGLLALLCAVTECLQVVRDVASDRAAGVRTTAVAFGAGATAWIARALVIAAAAYACLFLHRWIGLALLPAAFIPVGERSAPRAWDLFRVVFGAVWLGLLAAYASAGGLHGWAEAG